LIDSYYVLESLLDVCSEWLPENGFNMLKWPKDRDSERERLFLVDDDAGALPISHFADYADTAVSRSLK